MDLTRVIGKNTEIKKPTEAASPFIKKIPEKLIFKLLGDPRGAQHFIPMDYYRHQVGPNPEKDVRLRPSLKSLKLTQSAPENELYWSIVKQLGDLKKEGVPYDSDKPRALRAQKELYNAQVKGWFYLVQPGSPEIKPYLFPKTIINMLFGGREVDASGDVREVPSLLKKLQVDGYSPYDIDNDKCWLQLTKTGTGKGTRYFLEMVTQDTKIVHEGREVKITEPKEFPVHARLKNGEVTLEDFPDPIEFEKKYAFSEQETIAFIESSGTAIPERFQKRSRDDADMESGDDGAADQNAAPAFKQQAPDEISL